MANASIGGLISGLDTATIISQLMQLEALPQTQLKTRVSQDQKALGALQTLNAKIAGIATKAAELAKAGSWVPTKTTSSNTGVTVAGVAGAAVGSLTFTVDAVATSARSSYATTGQLTDAVMTPGAQYLIDHDGTGKASFTLDVGDGKLQTIANALNASGTGVKATLVRAGTAPDGTTPTYQLQVVSSTTGLDSGFTITEVDPLNPPNPPASPVAFMGGTISTTAGTNAQITIPGQAQPFVSSSNTFTGLMPGVDVTLATGATGSATVTIERDVTALSDKAKGLVDAVNFALTDIAGLTAYDPATKKAGLLAGDATLRTVRNQLLDLVTNGVDGTSLSTVGIEVDRSGKLTFDAAEFNKSYTADPVGTAAKFTGTSDWAGTGSVELSGSTWRTMPGSYAVVADATSGTIAGKPATMSGDLLTGAVNSAVEGLTLMLTGDGTGSVNGTVTYRQGFAAKLEALTQRLSDATEGTVSASIKNRTSTIKGMEDDIADWDVRLTSRQSTLQRQYAALEVALGKLQSQSSWLAGQINSLPTMSK